MIVPDVTSWSELDIPETDFDIAALYAALDRQREERAMTWQAVANALPLRLGAATLRSLQTKRHGVEADGVLQMLLWLDRTPETFVPGHPGANRPEARLAVDPSGAILRFDVPRIYSALDAARSARGISWKDAAAEIGGAVSAGALGAMRHRQRTAFPHVMRIARWLRCPAAALTRSVR